MYTLQTQVLRVLPFWICELKDQSLPVSSPSFLISDNKKVMKRVSIPGMTIVPPKATAGQCETAPHQIKLPTVSIFCGKRQSGKTLACVSLLEKLPFDRIFWVGVSIKSNQELIRRLKIEKEDMFEDTDDLSIVDKIRDAVEKEAQDLEKYEAEMKRYKEFMKLINSDSALFRLRDDDLEAFYANGEFQEPKHKYNGRKPCIGAVFDDAMGSMLYSKPRKLNALTTYSRHVGAFSDGRPAIGINLFFLVQTLKAQVGGLTKVIRNQASQYMIFRTMNRKELEDLGEAVSGEVSEDVFYSVYNHAIYGPNSDRHSFLLIDLNKKPNHPSMFRQGFQTFLVPE